MAPLARSLSSTSATTAKHLGKQKVAQDTQSDNEWLQQLGKNSYSIARKADTEVPYTGVSWREHRRGIFRCTCCETALFSSQTKFESGTGWPSFYQPIAKENIVERNDFSMGMSRTGCDARAAKPISATSSMTVLSPQACAIA